VLPEPTAIFGGAGELALLNGAARAILPGLARDVDLRETTYFEAVDGESTDDPDAPSTFEHPVVRVLRYGETVVGEEMRLRTPTGWLPVLVNAAPLRGPDRSVVGGILALTDISAVKAIAAEKDAFLSALSHDMKTPLTVVVGHAQLLQRVLRRGELNRERIEELAGHIDTTATRMALMVDELLDATSTRLRTSPVSRVPVDLRAVAESIIGSMSTISEGHTIVLDARTEDAVGVWNQRQVERVLFNLLENAIKFSPGGEIKVTLDDSQDDRGRWIRVSVEDHGIGIPASELDRIFDRFHRGANAGHIPGSGIGLASVQRMVAEHQGRVTVDSAVAVGTRVLVELPA
jgi:signal transduction histidine kinase